tara:strand:- start:115 stop:318 length:204 start_codon:yes stop_codon:yes gene_type:complete
MNPLKLENEESIILDKLYLALRPFDIILLSLSFPDLSVNNTSSFNTSSFNTSSLKVKKIYCKNKLEL